MLYYGTADTITLLPLRFLADCVCSQVLWFLDRHSEYVQVSRLVGAYTMQ
jgi:hypothetical protein